MISCKFERREEIYSNFGFSMKLYFNPSFSVLISSQEGIRKLSGSSSLAIFLNKLKAYHYLFLDCVLDFLSIEIVNFEINNSWILLPEYYFWIPSKWKCLFLSAQDFSLKSRRNIVYCCKGLHFEVWHVQLLVFIQSFQWNGCVWDCLTPQIVWFWNFVAFFVCQREICSLTIPLSTLILESDKHIIRWFSVWSLHDFSLPLEYFSPSLHPQILECFLCAGLYARC